MADPLVGSRATFLMDFEASLGTIKGTTVPKKIAIVSESLSGTSNLLKNPTIRADGNRAASVNGNVNASGSFSFVSGVDAAPWILKWLMHGITSTSGASDPYTHTFKWDITAVTFQSVAIEVAFTSAIIKKLLGCRIQKINLKFMSEGFLLWTIDVVALSATAQTSAVLVGTTTDWSSSTPIEMLQLAAADSKISTVASTTVGGNAACMRELELDITTNHTLDDYRMGQSGARSGLAVGSMDLNVKMKLAVEGATQMTFMQTGTAVSVDTTYTVAANRTLRILVPAFRVQKTLPNVSDDMGVYVDIEGIAEYDATAATMLQFVVVNANAAAYYA